MNAKLLGQHLLEAGLIDEDQLRIALVEQQKSRQPLGTLIHTLGFADEPGVSDVLSRQLGLERFDPVRHDINPEAIRLLPAETARHHRILPIDFTPGKRQWRLAMSSPSDHLALASVRAHTPAGVDTDILLAAPGEIEQAIDLHYGCALAIDGILEEFEGRGPLSALSGDSPAVRLIDALLADAVRRQASDIHFEPEAASLRIRYRIDGMLETIRVLHRSTWAPLTSRIKVISGMNIAENRLPQDGHLGRPIGGRNIDFRVSSQPTIHGESIVLRILDRQKGIVPLESLGVDDEHQNLLERMLSRPEGLFLVTGPTGSGKTTTLYSLLNRIRNDGVNVMTLEDPVEYPLPLLRQTSLSENVKMDFADGVRSMLRQDPDIMLIGEIRDAETAAMTLRAALTGHQVFATLHAGSAIAALSRLAEFGITPRMLHGNLTGIVAQRLVRRLCPNCRCERPASPAESALLGSPVLPAPGACPSCRQRGYRGRLVLMEVLRIDRALDLLLADAASPPELHSAARKRGFRTLADNALEAVRRGETTLEEVARSVDLSEWL
jgi:type II secretory ATPase GspE/PulE/Tfp pilus assembly ATPase PilB-like protein